MYGFMPGKGEGITWTPLSSLTNEAWTPSTTANYILANNWQRPAATTAPRHSDRRARGRIEGWLRRSLTKPGRSGGTPCPKTKKSRLGHTPVSHASTPAYSSTSPPVQPRCPWFSLPTFTYQGMRGFTGCQLVVRGFLRVLRLN